MVEIKATPKSAGAYRFGDYTGAILLSIPNKPCWFHRKMVKLILGWEWVDYE